VERGQEEVNFSNVYHLEQSVAMTT